MTTLWHIQLLVMKPTACRVTSVSTVDLLILKHKGLNERVGLIWCCKTSVGYDFTCEQWLKVFSRQVGGKAWHKAWKWWRPGATSESWVLDPTHPALGKHVDASCDNLTYPMPPCWSKLRNIFIARKRVIAKANAWPHWLCWCQAPCVKEEVLRAPALLLEAKGSQGGDTKRKYLTFSFSSFKMGNRNCRRAGAKVTEDFHLSMITAVSSPPQTFSPAVCPPANVFWFLWNNVDELKKK